MNNTVIGVAGYILLISNFILLIILVRKKVKCQSVSPFYILSTSDVLNAVLTGIILLINHVGITATTNDFYKNKLISKTDINDKYSDAFLQFYKTYNLSDSNYLNQTSCDVKHLLMHNAMFLMPFTNAFTSLLIFAIQCNLCATCISNRYKNNLQCPMTIEQNPIMDAISTNSRDEKLKTKQDIYRNILNVTKINKVLQFFQNTKFRNISETNKGIVGMGVLSQWLIPIFCTGALYFANYQNVDAVFKNKNTECTDETAISSYNYFLEDENVIFMENTHSEDSIIPMYSDNVSLASSFNQNVTQNDVISKVYDIVNLALNYTYNNSNDLERGNLTKNHELMQIKRDINADIIANDIMNSINTTNSKTNYNQFIITEDHDFGSNMSVAENVAIVKGNYEDIDKLHETIVLCTTNKCIVSTTFLRLYFLLLMFIIYFLPITLSSVLQVRGKLVCQNILSKLKEENSTMYSISHKGTLKGDNNKKFWKSKSSNDLQPDKEYNDGGDQGSRDIKITSGHNKIYEDVLKESIQVDKLFGTMKVSLIISIILWTPIFFQIILKIFLQIYISAWLIDCTFLCAICNCIIRNAFNLNMVKIQEIQKNVCRKENTVYPSEENI